MLLPKFLQPEIFPYTSVEIIPAKVTVEQFLARKTDSAPVMPTLTDALEAILVCAWCPGFVPGVRAQASQGMCNDCRAEFDADQDVCPGSRCSAACGGCGRCD